MANLAIASKVEGADIIKLPDLKIKRMRVRIIGTTPLVVHNWDNKIRIQLENKRTGRAQNKRGARNPVAEFEATKYLDSEGRDCIHAHGVKHAIVSAFRFADDVKRNVLTGAFFVEGELLPIEFDSVEMRTDMVRVNNKAGPRTGQPDIRYRAQYNGWSCWLPLKYNASVVSVEQLLNLIRLAGFSIGLYEFRPEKGGTWGQFDIDTEAGLLAGGE